MKTKHGKPTICRICAMNCGILVSEDQGRVTISGNPEHPVSQGFICFRGVRFSDVHQAPDRLDRPLLKKKGGWDPVSFPDALDILADRIKADIRDHGPAGFMVYKGESLKHQEIAGMLRHFCHALGSPNYSSVGSICHWALELGHGLTHGGIPKPDFSRHQAAVMWGCNPPASYERMWAGFKKKLANGLPMMVIDPSRTETARQARVHLAPKPGTDGFLALALLKEAAKTLAPAPDAAVGWTEFRDYLAGLDRDDLLERCGLGLDEFRHAADFLLEHQPIYIKTGNGLELQPNGIQTLRAVACLGSLLDPDLFVRHQGAPFKSWPGSDACPPRVEPIGCREAPVLSQGMDESQAMFLFEALERGKPYPIQNLFVVGANPLMTWPAVDRYEHLFGKLGFLTVYDLFMTRTARAADLVLPAATHLENLEIHDYGAAGPPVLGLIRPVLDSGRGLPLGKIVLELAARLGLSDFFPFGSLEEVMGHRLDGVGVGLDQLLASPAGCVPYRPRPKPQASWHVADGRLHFVSEILAAQGYAGFPTLESLTLPHGQDREYPFLLNTGDRLKDFHHSQYRTIPGIRRRHPEPRLEVHPEAAARLGLADGDWAETATRHGRLTVQVSLTPDNRPDLLRLAHGWEEANSNELSPLDHFDPISGFPWLKALPASLRKADAS